MCVVCKHTVASTPCPRAVCGEREWFLCLVKRVLTPCSDLVCLSTHGCPPARWLGRCVHRCCCCCIRTKYLRSLVSHYPTEPSRRFSTISSVPLTTFLSPMVGEGGGRARGPRILYLHICGLNMKEKQSSQNSFFASMEVPS